ncbi:MAG: alpha/beta hydrolase [Mycobacteriaceae bacterium]|nr:alpha/beta hydrolase [Mycobacteriaceae bacterium]
MSEMSCSPVASETPSSVTVELVETAALGTIVAHYLLRGTLGLTLDVLTLAGSRNRSLARAGFWAIERLVDPPARVMLPPRGTRRRLVQFKDFRAEWLWDTTVADPKSAQDAAILYLHGGAFIACGLNTHRRMVAKIAQATGVPALNVDYRQLPDAHVTDSLDDAMRAYRYLLDRGFAPERIILSGDSAGGGLALRLAQAVRDAGYAAPAAISVVSPWADFDSARRHAHRNTFRDAYLPGNGPDMVVRQGFSIDGAIDPSWSPVNNDFAGLPPILIQVGSDELLLPDSETLAQRCEEAGVPTRLQIWHRAPHVHQIGADILRDARNALADLVAFNRQALVGEAASTAGVSAA